MVEKHRNISLGIFLNIGIGVVFLIAAVITVVAVNQAMRRQAMIEAESKARIILDRNFATHTYFSQNLKPRLFEWGKPILTKDYFDPTWMSSTYAVREIEKYFKSFNPADYYFRDAAINARSPENEADAFENTFVKEINADKTLEAKSSIRTINGKPYLVVLRRGEVMEESCLRCHSNSGVAPTGLVAIYGPERSFHRKLGETISAVSLRIPLSEAYKAADAFSWRLSSILLLVLAALFLSQYTLYRRFLLRPLAALKVKAGLIASSTSHLGDQIPLPFGRELNGLTRAFNTMSATLRHDRDHLEETVAQRTQDLKVAVDQYRQERNFVDRLLQTAQAIVLLLDAEGRIVRVNRYLEELTGYRMEELEGKDWFTTFLPEDDRERTRNLFLKAVGDLETRGNVSPILTKDGRLRQIQWYDRSLKDEEGRLIGLLCTGVDITERLKAEEERLALERKVQQAQKRESLITMAGAIAHHFNNQLTTVLGYLQLAREIVPRASTLGEYLLESENAGKRSAELSRLMLTYVGLGIRRVQPLDLKTLISDLLPDIQAAMPPTVSLKAELPDVPCPVMMEPGEVRQVVMNLVTNAWEAIGNEEGTVGIAVRSVSGPGLFEGFNPTGEMPGQGPWICLEVRDTGSGMDQKTLERLFDPFFSTKFTGRGLGMAVTLGIVEACDGAIFVKSAPERGTTVRVFFPKQ
jgi:PAS domain S-box-containing protein